MGLGSHYVSSPRYCFSTQDYNEWMDKHYPNIDDGEKKLPKRFCDKCQKHREFVNDECAHYRLHKHLVTCNYCQKDFKTFNNRDVRCSSCCRLNESKLKTYTSEKLKKLASVYNIKRRKQEYIIDDLVQKVENYIS